MLPSTFLGVRKPRAKPCFVAATVVALGYIRCVASLNVADQRAHPAAAAREHRVPPHRNARRGADVFADLRLDARGRFTAPPPFRAMGVTTYLKTQMFRCRNHSLGARRSSERHGRGMSPRSPSKRRFSRGAPANCRSPADLI